MYACTYVKNACCPRTAAPLRDRGDHDHDDDDTKDTEGGDDGHDNDDDDDVRGSGRRRGTAWDPCLSAKSSGLGRGAAQRGKQLPPGGLAGAEAVCECVCQ